MKSLISLCLFLIFSSIHAAPAFTAGKDYQDIIKNPAIPASPEGKVRVTEFFSYGCPWCFRLEPSVESWEKSKPKDVVFERIPVVFEPGWNYYAKAYYTAQALGISQKMSPLLFNAIQKQRKNLKSDKAMIAFFTAQGVKPDVAKSAFESSPSLDAKVKQGVQLMQAYQVYLVPSIVVDGVYKTDLKMAQGDGKRMMDIVEFLVNKVKNKQAE